MVSDAEICVYRGIRNTNFNFMWREQITDNIIISVTVTNMQNAQNE